jgi:type II secretory pathway pseudopilin PulG
MSDGTIMTLSARSRPHHQRGYVLLTLLLAMAILVIAAGVGATSIAFNIRRDREEELIHRGVQYTRAIRAYSKKTGRYPMTLEELDNVNGLRFLRKHYKDPITGQDFKLVYMSQVVTIGPSPSQQLQNLNGTPGFNSPNGPRNGASQQSNGANDQGQSPAPADAGQSTPPDPPSNTQNSAGASSDSGSGSDQLHPAGMIVGVVSASKDKTIREFNGKNHYDQWRFYYDPAFDNFALMNAPTIKPGLETPKLAGASTPDQMNSRAYSPIDEYK